MGGEDFVVGLVMGLAITTLIFVIGAATINRHEREACIQVTGAEDCVQVWMARQ